MNITLKTIDKVRNILSDEKQAVSINYISQKGNLHPYRVKTAIEELCKCNEIKIIENSTGVNLYAKSD